MMRTVLNEMEREPHGRVLALLLPRISNELEPRMRRTICHPQGARLVENRLDLSVTVRFQI